MLAFVGVFLGKTPKIASKDKQTIMKKIAMLRNLLYKYSKSKSRRSPGRFFFASIDSQLYQPKRIFIHPNQHSQL
jgi:hypothetical protein